MGSEFGLSSDRKRSGRRAARNKAIEGIVVLIFLVLLITLVLPWAGSTLADGFRDVMATPR